MVAAVPAADRFTTNIIQHPARAGLHADLVDAVAEHVIVITHDDAALRIAALLDGVAHFALIAFDILLDAGLELYWRSIRSEPVVRESQERASQRVKVCDRWGVGVGGGLLGSVTLWVVCGL